ncbi:hypothetical protein FOZ61_002837 [Perkinsus olseni]|uniref:Uncharacterized protein n=1 Tax=Perkinsus olseni TaxID=32597 RepID=A0A7J6LRY5_PEROL|nr:hypothetical protein FOZ61_002837 [Perkinsus olseni]
MAPSVYSPGQQTSPVVSARSSRIQRVKERLVQLQQEYHAGVLADDSSESLNDTSLNASDIRHGRSSKALNPARCRVCVCGPSVSSVLSREKVALVRRDRERIDGTAARQLAELEARAVDGEGRYEAALADLTRRIQEEEEAQGSSAVRAEEVRARLDRMVSANATLRADLQERERKIEKEEQEIHQETDRLNESLAAANRELSAFLAGRGFHNEGEDVEALREAVEDQHSTNAQLERELEQVRGMLEDETERAESVAVELETVQQECAEMHEEVTTKTAMIEERETKLAETKEELEDLQKEVADKEAQLARRREEYDAVLESIKEEEDECNELEANLAQRQRDLKAREQVLTEALEQLRSQRRSTSRLSDGPNGSDDGECLQEEDETERDIRLSELRLKLESQKMELAVQEELKMKNERLVKDLEDRIQCMDSCRELPR